MNDDKIKKYITILEESNIDGLEISSFWGFRKIKLTKSATKLIHGDPSSQNLTDVTREILEKSKTSDSLQDVGETKKTSLDEANSKNNLEINTEDIEEIKSPLVGTYYSRPKPNEPEFVQIGDKITPGRTLFIIEAMKIFNEIESDYSGRVIDIKVEDNNPVEFDQVVMTIVKD